MQTLHILKITSEILLLYSLLLYILIKQILFIFVSFLLARNANKLATQAFLLISIVSCNSAQLSMFELTRDVRVGIDNYQLYSNVNKQCKLQYKYIGYLRTAYCR